MIVATLKCHGSSTPGALNDLPALFEASLTFISALPKCYILMSKTPSPNAQPQSSLAEQVNHSIVLSEKQRMTQRQISHSRVQANAPRALGSSSQDNSWIRAGQCMMWSKIAMMFPNPTGIKAETFRSDNLFKQLHIKSGERG